MSYLPSSAAHASKAGIDLKTATQTLLFVTEPGTRRFYPTDVIVELTSADAVSVVASISVGTAAGGFADVLGAYTLTGLDSTNEMLTIPLTTVISSLAAATGVFVNVAVGATATTCTGKVIVRGF